MAEEFSLDQARDVIEGGLSEAKEMLGDPSKMNELLAQIETKAKDLPSTVGGALSQLPTMAAMVKGYVTKEYTEVSPKVIATVVSAFLYLVKKKDLIPDNVPVLGLVDDLAVVTVALKLNEPELKAFSEWQESQKA